MSNTVKESSMRYSVGIDGCKGGWIAVGLGQADVEGDIKVLRAEEIGHVLQAFDITDTVLIDIPIGLAESEEESRMRPDSHLRKQLLDKGSSVFNAPFRQIARAATVEEAWDLNRKLNGKMQIVSMGIRRAVGQVDLFLEENPQWKNRILESHPEYCFMLFNKAPLGAGKKEAEGQLKRLNILKELCPETAQVIAAFKKDYPRVKKVDDLLDALCLAAAGRLGSTHGFGKIPSEPVEDSRGIFMQVVYPVLPDAGPL